MHESERQLSLILDLLFNFWTQERFFAVLGGVLTSRVGVLGVGVGLVEVWG